ncbi:MAG TPA: universal stress protein, partial [Acidimicrobiia bacterium]|nr:universal stress protein [Acidimicrobiia bacterium]
RRGRGDLGGLLLGSVSHKVAHLASCAVMTVR